MPTPRKRPVMQAQRVARGQMVRTGRQARTAPSERQARRVGPVKMVKTLMVRTAVTGLTVMRRNLEPRVSRVALARRVRRVVRERQVQSVHMERMARPVPTVLAPMAAPVVRRSSIRQRVRQPFAMPARP
jgi:hypothetical protein